MEIHVSHRTPCWDDVTDDYVERQVLRVASMVHRRGLRATTLHVAITEEGHHRTECTVTLHVPGALLHARASSRSEFVTIRDAFRELRTQLRRHGVRQLPRPRAEDEILRHAS